MRSLINYIRSCFCKHEWEYEECDREEKRYDRFDCYYQHPRISTWTVVSATCKKCGWHRSYRKF